MFFESGLIDNNNNDIMDIIIIVTRNEEKSPSLYIADIINEGIRESASHTNNIPKFLNTSFKFTNLFF